MFPAISVDLVSIDVTGAENMAADDWMQIDPVVLIKRVSQNLVLPSEWEQVLSNTRPLIEDGVVVGRLCMLPELSRKFQRSGIKPVNSATCALVAQGVAVSHFAKIGGIVTGKVTRAARDQAVPSVRFETVRAWAGEQANLLYNMKLSSEVQAGLAHLVSSLSGDVGLLKIVECSTGWLNAEEVRIYVQSREWIFITQDAAVSVALHKRSDYKMADNVLAVDKSLGGIYMIDRHINAFLQKLEFPSQSEALEEQPTANWGREALDGLILEIAATVWNLDREKLDEYTRTDNNKYYICRRPIIINAQSETIEANGYLIEKDMNSYSLDDYIAHIGAVLVPTDYRGGEDG